ncbi:MAG: hypothetical protein CBC55_04875 [Gammaproteobacteria bacterium TMED95]|nr:MAG: hypothetical protein CBC55_04875 [Gammaproteobacteria bacterium TMED95]|tara:strand:+ start:3500 stop:3991 length:492 start_codon:yes stop_codon:yes gene_type:complete
MAQEEEMSFESFNVDQMALVTAITGELSKQNPSLPFEPALFNKIVEAANMIVEECRRERTFAEVKMTPQEWLVSDDVGESSQYMLTVLADIGRPMPNGETPRDVDDLARCIRMVTACGLESKIPKLRVMGDRWNRIAEYWDELKALYAAKKHDEICDFLLFRE